MGASPRRRPCLKEEYEIHFSEANKAVISKLGEALKIDQKKHDALWTLKWVKWVSLGLKWVALNGWGLVLKLVRFGAKIAQDLEIASLKAKIKMLEHKDGEVAEPSGEDATIKGRSLKTVEEAGVDKSTKRGSNDTEKLVNVLTSLDAANILTSGGVQVVSIPPAAEVSTVSVLPTTEIPTVSVPTGSGMVPTANPIFTTPSVVTHYAGQKGKEMMVESDTPKKKKLQEQIDVNNETIAKYLQEYQQFAADFSIGEKIELINDLVKYQDNYAKVLKYQSQQKKPLSKKQQREFYTSIEDFVPMGSKEEGEQVKRKGLNLEQESTKKMKTSEEIFEEDLKEMMQLILVEEVYVETLQLDREDLSHMWTLVKETLIIRQATNDKEKELWVELKRLFEPDVEDQLWTHTQALIHDPVEWRLYDSCGVRHVLSGDQEIFMLVERDYPLRKGTAIVMIRNKLQVENYSQMANDLILKIHQIANSPRQRGIPTASDEFPLPDYFLTASEEEFPLLRDLLRDGMTESGVINLEDITLLELNNILEYYMQHYRNPDKDLKAWDDDFVQSHLSSLSNLEDLFQAANYLGIDSLMDLCTQAYESMVKEGRFSRCYSRCSKKVSLLMPR
nr:hypothetical protein [Tanacetum cinerariifolium]